MNRQKWAPSPMGRLPAGENTARVNPSSVQMYKLMGDGKFVTSPDFDLAGRPLRSGSFYAPMPLLLLARRHGARAP